jgi:hypothetical protein
MTTSTPTATASIPFAAVETARKAAAAKASAKCAEQRANGDWAGDSAKRAAATRAANRQRMADEAAALAAEREQAIADAPIRRAKLAVATARKFDRHAAHMAQVEAQMDRINRMREAARLVNLLGLRADGTINRNPNSKKRHLMVTRDNCDSIIARAARSRSLAS